jgi:hypothetical protein
MTGFVPLGSNSSLGVVQGDGTTFTIDSNGIGHANINLSRYWWYDDLIQDVTLIQGAWATLNSFVPVAGEWFFGAQIQLTTNQDTGSAEITYALYYSGYVISYGVITASVAGDYSATLLPTPVGTDGQHSIEFKAYTNQKDIIVLVAPHTYVFGFSGGVAGFGTSHLYLGNNTIGASTMFLPFDTTVLKQITLPSSGIITSIGAYVVNYLPNHQSAAGVGVLSDNGGVPGQIIAYSPFTPESNVFLAQQPGWLHMPVGVWLPAGTYWLAFVAADADGQFLIYYDSGGSDVTWQTDGAWLSQGGQYSLVQTTQNFSIRADFLFA